MNGEAIPSTFKSKQMKVLVLWILFISACLGTYGLSHRIQIKADQNAAGAFLATGKRYEVSLSLNGFEPSSIRIKPGDEVSFTVKDASRHNIAEERRSKSDARFESGEISSEDKYSLTPSGPGVVYLYDRMNLDSHFKIIVEN